MKKNLLYFSLLFICACNDSDSPRKANITGEVTSPLNMGDTVYFSKGFLDEKYFENHILSAKITNGKFNLNKVQLSYPHKYVVYLKSDRPNILYRGGDYFIDSSSTSIKLDSIDECSRIEGRINDEFNNKFLPYLFKNTSYDCKQSSFMDLRYSKDSIYKRRLSDYISHNPDSYVGLWLLIEQIEMEGYSQLLEKSLQSFSPIMKQQKLWKLANESFSLFSIKENQVFPALNLKTQSYELKKLELPETKYILVDFWFSRCKPCLKAFPKLKELYVKFHKKGFEIISISTDKTEDTDVWKQKIVEQELLWPQYLDENGVIAEKNKITFFPTTFLLNNKKQVIKKNISLEELEKLLENMVFQDQ